MGRTKFVPSATHNDSPLTEKIPAKCDDFTGIQAPNGRMTGLVRPTNSKGMKNMSKKYVIIQCEVSLIQSAKNLPCGCTTASSEASNISSRPPWPRSADIPMLYATAPNPLYVCAVLNCCYYYLIFFMFPP